MRGALLQRSAQVLNDVNSALSRHIPAGGRSVPLIEKQAVRRFARAPSRNRSVRTRRGDIRTAVSSILHATIITAR
jgi:hypothetical protein